MYRKYQYKLSITVAKLSSCFAVMSLISIFPSVFAASLSQVEEVLVQTDKSMSKEENVTVSVGNVSGEKLEASDIGYLQEMTDYVANLNMTQTGLGSVISIRGITSDINPGFEQSVALMIDGVRHGRAQLARAPFLDIDNADVLRGPQSVLWGKNTTAGVISINTRVPNNLYEGSTTLNYNPEISATETRIVISGPLNENFAGRLAIMNSDSEGFIENTTLDQSEMTENERVIRTTFIWKPSDAWSFKLKVEDGKFNNVGRNIEVISPISINPNDSNPYTTFLSYLTAGSYYLDTKKDGLRQSNGDYSYNDTNNITLTAHYSLVNNIDLTSTTAYNSYSTISLCDCDFTGVPIVDIGSVENYRQFNQEYKISSNAGSIDWVVGVLYQRNFLGMHHEAKVPFNSSVTSAAISPLLLGASSQRNFTQHIDLYSVFTQFSWNLTESTKLLLGARSTYEDKTAERFQYHVTPSGTVLSEGSVNDTYNQLWALFKVEPNKVFGKRNEGAFTPEMLLKHSLSPNISLHAGYTTGVKSGGFDAFANAAPHHLGGIYPDIEGSWEFGSEKIQNYSAGGDFLFSQASAELSVNFFRAYLESMQTNQYDQGIGYIVNNNGAAVVQGMELDGRWTINENLFLRSSAALLDFKYTRYPTGQCYFGQIDNHPPFDDGACDFSHKTREFAPKKQVSIGIDYRYPTEKGLTLMPSIDFIYSSSYYTATTLDPRMKQEGYFKINMRLALVPSDNKWELAVLAKNLTNEAIITYANELPLSSAFTQKSGSAYVAFYEQPRSFSFQARINF